jgi:flagellar brake protein
MTYPNNSGSGTGGLLNPELHPELIIRNPAEILSTLRRLRDSRVLVNVHLDRGQNGFVSALLDASNEAVILDVSPDEWINERARSAGVLICSTQLDRVRIQFELAGVTATTHQTRPALQAALPLEMLRLQRRDSYRLPVPQHSRIDCVIRLPHPDQTEASGQTVEHEPRVVDISTEGVALLLPNPDLPLTVGTLLQDSVLSLPEGDSARLTLRVQNLQHITLPNGTQNLRLGCQMIGASPRFVAQLQRYIFKIERERKLLEND